MRSETVALISDRPVNARRAPVGLGREGSRIWAAATAAPWTAVSDLPLLHLAAVEADDLARMREQAATDPSDWRLRGQIGQGVERMCRLLGLLGLTAMDRQRLGYGKEEASLEAAEQATLASLRKIGTAS